jgi:hypothetical protein
MLDDFKAQWKERFGETPEAAQGDLLIVAGIAGATPALQEAAKTLKDKSEVHISSILEIADRMIVISDQGFVSCEDDGCLMLNGMVREAAYRLRDAAERERQAHGTRENQRGGRAGSTIGRKKAK